MDEGALRSLVIVGGGTAGWMAASLLARTFRPGPLRITVIEGEETGGLGAFGSGEAATPLMRKFNAALGIDETRFVAQTSGTFRLGTEFRDWCAAGNVHFHGFGDYGEAIEGIAPHHFWLRLNASGNVPPIDDWSLPYAAASRGRFLPCAAQTAAQTAGQAGEAVHYRHGYHFDAALHARYLRAYAERRGVERIEGHAVDATLDGESGHIVSVVLADGRRVEGDFFIDCSGFAGQLIEKALKTGYEDWSHWLPCDSALVASAPRFGPPPSHTVSSAQEAGWQWHIPLQQRDDSGYAYSSRFTDDEQARNVMLANLAATPLAEPRLLRFTAGHRRKFWNRNCLALGPAGGFLDPLEATSIRLIQTTLTRFIEFFPDRTFDPVIEEEFNRLTVNEWARIRDFAVLHYFPSRRPEPLWRYCRSMELPDTLVHKLEVWKATGRVPMLSGECFDEPSWVAILLGNGIIPRRIDPIAARMDTRNVALTLKARREAVVRAAHSMPTHAQYIERNCTLESLA